MDKEQTIRPKLMVEKGLRAQLKTGNLLTGQLFIDLDYHPDAAPATMKEENGYQVFPTISTPLERIMERVEAILKKVDELPLDKIGKNTDGAIKDLNALLKEFGAISGKVNRETLPRVNESLDELTYDSRRGSAQPSARIRRSVIIPVKSWMSCQWPSVHYDRCLITLTGIRRL